MDSSYEAPSAVINGQSACFNPKEYFIDITPEKDESLTCDRQKVTVRVLDKDGKIATDYTGDIHLSSSLTRAGKARWFGTESGGTSLGDVKNRVTVTPNRGQKTLWLKSEHIGKITVTATLSKDDKKTDSSTFLFVPYGFEIAEGELPLVAGKPVDIAITALACPSEKGQMVATEYQGNRILTLETVYDSPSTGSQRIQLAKPNSTEWQSRQLSVHFEAGKASAQLRYLDAGTARLTLKDEQCTTSDCAVIPVAQRMYARALADWQGLTGSQTIKARPYTFALCDADNLGSGQQEKSIQAATGTANNGNAFVAAGERFATRVKPVIWTESDAGKDNIAPNGDATKLVDTRHLCERMETTNFYHAQAPAAKVQLTIPAGDNAKPHSPNVAGARPGVLTRSPLTHEEIATQPFYASWSEVGSIQLRAGVQGTYLGMKVNIGYRPVGRFYPKFMAVVPSESGMTYPNGQDFVYMNQPFNGQLTVQAQNQQQEPTYNYGYFADAYKVGIQMVAAAQQTLEGTGNRLTERMDFSEWDRVAGDHWRRNWQQEAITVPTAPLLFTRLNAMQGATVSAFGSTQPDGPYRVALGIAPQEVENCAQMGCPELNIHSMTVFNCSVGTACESTFRAQSFATFSARYGRMVMDDTAGRSGQALAIPLRVEYWNGKAFTVHEADHVSVFDGEYFCQQPLSDPAVRGKTLGNGEVTQGQAASGALNAQQDAGSDDRPHRAQIRFWQKLVDNAPSANHDADLPIYCQSGTVDREGGTQPWLLYNWRKQGDENPSAVVTFGTYRGNDRVIYRGEKGMNFRLP
ncbi:DUF6701 domain-containing protein [Photobacterium aphoticum]|nr:DUF6701 domain-containing protein [Photobacterium aphoticum]